MVGFVSFFFLVGVIEATPRSSVIFDGRTLHKGLKIDSDKIRYAIYKLL